MAELNWRLPAGVDEWLPPAAWSLEQTRRRVLDVCHAWGYQYIEPPIIEYLDALLVGADDELNLQTLKAVDQRTGRMLGVRADITCQAVRVDAHSLPLEGVQRLCYAGNVVFANPVAPLDTRVPLKAGAELFGAASLSADAEVVALMLEVLAAAGAPDPVVVLGHMGIFQHLSDGLGLAQAQQTELFAAMQSKAETDIADLVGDHACLASFVALPGLMGGRSVLESAREVLAGAGEPVSAALDALDSLADLLLQRCPGMTLRFDLAEVAGYGYHNGPVFTAYRADLGRALARGGRYDGIGAGFGRSRPATGFDVSLKELADTAPQRSAVWAPWPIDKAGGASFLAEVGRLRAQGEVVVAALSAEDQPPEFCDRRLVQGAQGWQLTTLDPQTTSR